MREKPSIVIASHSINALRLLQVQQQHAAMIAQQ
jgi:hypothetical protein